MVNGFSKDIFLNNKVKKLADALPRIIKAVEDLYILITDILVD